MIKWKSIFKIIRGVTLRARLRRKLSTKLLLVNISVAIDTKLFINVIKMIISLPVDQVTVFTRAQLMLPGNFKPSALGMIKADVFLEVRSGMAI